MPPADAEGYRPKIEKLVCATVAGAKFRNMFPLASTDTFGVAAPSAMPVMAQAAVCPAGGRPAAATLAKLIALTATVPGGVRTHPAMSTIPSGPSRHWAGWKP